MNEIERLWNGWRSAYVTGEHRQPPGEGSIFSRIFASDRPDTETYIVHRAPLIGVVLNVFPYTTGHALVVPYREVADLEELTDAEHEQLWDVVRAAVRAVKSAYRPGGVNVGLNLGHAAGGSIAEHLHVHVLPRWAGDGNFIAAVANARTLPEPLETTLERLKAAWPA